jgi:hypothetical protein
MFRQLPPFRVLICGTDASRENVFRALELLAKRYEITTIIQTEDGPACQFADEWAHLNDADRVKSNPVHRKDGGRRGTCRLPRLFGLKVQGVIAFPGGRYRKDIADYALKHDIKVWAPYG